MSVPHWFKIFLLAILLPVSVALLVAALVIGTEAGRVWLAETGLSIAAGRFQGQLQWRGVKSPAINHWRLDKLTVSEQGAGRIEAAGVDLRWQPQQLLRGRLVLDALRFERIAVEPPAGGTGTTTGTPATGIILLPVAVHALSVESLLLPVSVENFPREWRVKGTLKLWSGTSPLAADLQISPRADNKGKLSLSVRAARDGAVGLSGWYSESPDGPVSIMLRLPHNESFDTSFNARLDRPAGAYRLAIKELTSNLWQHDFTIQGEVQQKGKALTTRGLHLDVDGSEQVLQGRVSKQGMDLQLDLADMPLDIASAWTGVALDGSAAGHIDIQGNFADPSAAGELKIHTQYHKQPITMEVRATANRDTLHIDRSAIATRDGLLMTAGGTVDIRHRTLDLDTVIDDTDLARIRGLGLAIPDTIKGAVNAHTKIRGSWERPALELQGGFNGYYKDNVPLVLNIAANTMVPAVPASTQGGSPHYVVAVQHMDLRVSKHQVTGQGQLTMSLQPLDLEIRDARIGVAGTSHPLSGKIQGDKLALNLTLDTFPLDILAPLLDSPVTGAVSGKVFLGGTFSDPRLQGKFNSDLTWLHVPVHVNGEVDASRKSVQINQMDLSSGTGSLSVKGLVDLVGSTTRVQVNARDLETSLLPHLGGWVPPRLDGKLQADLTITGRTDQLDAAGTAQFAGSYQRIPVNLSLTGAGSRTRFSVSQMKLTTSGGGQLTLRGGYGGKSGADFKLEGSKLPVQLFNWRDWELPPGNVNVTLAVQGTPQRPEVSGKISYLQTGPGEGGGAALSAFDAQLELDQKQLKILLTLAGEKSRTGNIRVSLPWRRYLERPTAETLAQTPLAGTLHAEAYLQEICALLVDTDIHDCKGGINADLTLGNTLGAPRIDGRIVLENGYYENMVSGTSLQDIHVDVRAAGNRLEVVKATAGDGDKGTLALEGTAGWRESINDLDVNLALHVKDAHLIHRYDMDGVANGALTLTGGLKELMLSGGLEIRPFTLELESLLQEDIPTLKVTNDDTQVHRQQASRQKWQWLPSVHLNVVLKADQQAYLRGQGLEAELQGKVQIQGTYPDTVYRGNFKTIRGNIHILGKKFILSGGDVRLENDVYSLRIPAVYQGQDIQVNAVLSGTTDELHLDLNSAPSYPEDEIVSRLLFNKSSESISPLQAIRLANAITILKFGGKPLFDPLSKIQKTLSLDSLNLEDAANGNGVMLGVGKYITEKVYVEVETGTGAGEPWQGNIQIELLPNLNLENTINSETGFGNIQLQWKKDY